MKKGLLVVLVGPSGSGKGTVLAELLKGDQNLFLSVSTTTRAPRVGEENGVHYNFVEKAEFERLISDNQMLEYASYCDNYYGTPKAAVFAKLEQGKNVILEIEMQGASQIKAMYPQAVLVFITPPSLKILRKRLTERGTEEQHVVEKRLKTAVSEMYFAPKCDYIVVNDTVQKAASDIGAIILANTLNSSEMKQFIEEVLDNA